jgi:hypothetical protein
MKLLDKIALNRLISIILGFIITIIKLFSPQIKDTDIDTVEPKKRKRIFPRVKK